MAELTKDWEIDVYPGRSVQIDLRRNSLRITRIRMGSHSGTNHKYPNGQCRVYLGNYPLSLDKTEIGILNWPDTITIVTDVLIDGSSRIYGLCHSGYGVVTVSGTLEFPLRVTPNAIKANERAWDLPCHITSEVLSFLDATDVARLECLTKIFHDAGHMPRSYSDNIDLTRCLKAEDLDVTVLMRRSFKPRCLLLGSEFSDGAIQLPNLLITSRWIDDLAVIGCHLKKIHLCFLLLITRGDLETVFTSCPNLADFKFMGMLGFDAPLTTEDEEKFREETVDLVTVDELLNLVAKRGKQLEALWYSDITAYPENKIRDDSFNKFLENCTKITHLTFGRVNVTNAQVLEILGHFKCLRHLKLFGSVVKLFRSVGYTDDLLRRIDENTGLEELIIELSSDACSGVGDFLDRLKLPGTYPNMKKIVIRLTSYEEYFLWLEAERTINNQFVTRVRDLKEARPHLKLDVFGVKKRTNWEASAYARDEREKNKNAYNKIYDPLRRRGGERERRTIMDVDAYDEDFLRLGKAY